MPARTRIFALAFSLAALSCPAYPASADKVIREASRLVNKGNSAEAILLVRRSLDEQPGDALLHRVYQILMANSGHSAEVEREYRDRLEAHPGDGLAAYLFFVAANDEREARALLAAQKISPDDPWIEAATTLLAVIGDIGEGRESAALEKLKNSPNLRMVHDDWGSRAWAYMELGRFKEAEREAGDAVAAMPFDPTGYEAQGRVFCDTSRYERCLEAFDAALRLRDSPSSRFSRAYALRMNGRTAESEKDFETALAMTPLSPADFAAHGWIHAYRGDLKKSWDSMNEAKQRTSCLCMQTSMIWLELRIFGAKQARKDCDAILKLNPRNVDARSLSGTIHQEQGCECQEAIADFDEVLKINPRYLTAWLGKVRANLTLGRADAAVADAREAMKLAPKDWETVLLMAGASMAARRYEDAARYARDSLSLYPENPETRTVLGKAYLFLDRAPEAERAFEEAREHHGVADLKIVEEMIKTAKEAVRSARFKEATARPRPKAQASDFRKAPASIKDFLKVPEDSEWTVSLTPLRSLGSKGVPWLKKMVLSDNDGISFGKRSRAATLLAEFQRWDDLADILAGGGQGATLTIGPLTGGLLKSSDTTRIPLPRIEGLASKGNSAALTILGTTRNREYAPVCADKVLYSRWPATPEPMKSAVERFLAACPREDDWDTRFSALNCLDNLGAPASIPVLLDASERTSAPLRRRIIATLSSIAKENFGEPPEEASSTTAGTFCRDSYEEVWELSRASAPAAQAIAQLESIARVAENMAARDAARGSDGEILLAWKAWWRTQEGRVPPAYAERTIKEVRAPDSEVSMALLSSGKVAIRGPMKKRESTFANISSVEKMLEHEGGRWIFGVPEDQTRKLADWARREALPILRRARTTPAEKRDR